MYGLLATCCFNQPCTAVQANTCAGHTASHSAHSMKVCRPPGCASAWHQAAIGHERQ